MKRSTKLKPVVELAEKAVETALLRVAEANAIWQQEQQQLDALLQYREEYFQRFRSSQQQMNVQKTIDLHIFIAQLDQAIKAQQYQVDQCQLTLKQQRVAWEKERVKERAVLNLSDRYQAQEQHQMKVREQRDNDEYNTIRWRYQRGQGKA